jgi:hypothetical protein
MNIGDECDQDLISTISNGIIEAIDILTTIESILLWGSSIVGNL